MFPQARPLTGDEFLALDGTGERIELFDGNLHLSPNPGVRHQHATGQVAGALDDKAERTGLIVLTRVSVRLRDDRIPTADLVITSDTFLDGPVLEARTVCLVGEILSPASRAVDTILKKHYYAEAGIPWYLVADPDGPTLHCFELAGKAYKEHLTAKPGEVLELVEPVAVELDPRDLLPRGR
ncbi:Uma2 family endonuclease [Paractinoplanes ovalisporus]|nr:Uma2 family endonuclease [Actinoplanes ovalisporus]